MAPRRGRVRRQQPVEAPVPLRWRLAALVVIIIAVWLPRGLALDRMVTPDEPIWLARSANFYEALTHRRWADTYQYAHPGVTVMWLGAAAYRVVAPDYPKNVLGQVPQRGNRISPILAAQGLDPLKVLAAGRAAMVLAITLAIGAAFWAGMRLLGFWEAVLGFLLIALDPFPIGLSRLLHVDAIDSAFSLVAVMFLLCYLYRGRRRRDLLISGAAAGLAWLTRSQSLFLLAFAGLLLSLDLFGQPVERLRRRWRRRSLAIPFLRIVALPLVAWTAAGGLTVLLLWPALWVSPKVALRGIIDGASTAAAQGHERAIFFVGFVYQGDPGLRFYPVTFLWRATPIALIGLVLAAIMLVQRRRHLIAPSLQPVLLSLLLYAGIYAAFMSLAAKKFDRYLLPAYAPLALVAACAWLAAARWLHRRFRTPRRATLAAVGALAVAVQLTGPITTYPYYLSYYSPLLGGATRAQDDMMVGWGEGYDQIARYLNDLPNAEQLVVATDSWRSPLSFFFKGSAQYAGFFDDPAGLFRWASSDYYVLYITPRQRQMIPQPFLDELADREPELTVVLNGLEYAHLYDIRDDPIPTYLQTGRTGMTDWIGLGRLVAANQRADEVIQPGTTVTEVLYFERVDPSIAPDDVARDLGLLLRVVSPSGREVVRSDGPLELLPPRRHGLWTVERTFTMPLTSPGLYRVEAILYDRATGQPLPVFDARLSMRRTPPIVVDTFSVSLLPVETSEP